LKKKKGKGKGGEGEKYRRRSFSFLYITKWEVSQLSSKKRDLRRKKKGREVGVLATFNRLFSEPRIRCPIHRKKKKETGKRQIKSAKSFNSDFDQFSFGLLYKGEKRRGGTEGKREKKKKRKERKHTLLAFKFIW